jgi:hypothetical protein
MCTAVKKGIQISGDSKMTESTKQFTVKFLDFDCIVETGQYNNGRLAIELYDKEDGEPVTTATINLPMESMKADEVAIKNYSENEGIVEALKEAGVITEKVRDVGAGFTIVPVYKVNPDLLT